MSIKVKALQTHLGIYGLITVGKEYETTELHAAELKRNGLVESDVKSAQKIEGQSILVSDKKENVITTTAIIGDTENGEMVAVNKNELEIKKKEANLPKKK